MSKARGFTLLELIIVMAVMAVAVAVVTPRLTGNQLSELKAQVREAVSVLKYARQSAIVGGREQVVLLYPPIAEDQEDATGSEKIRPKRSKAGLWVSRGAQLEWESASPEQQDDGAYVLRFYPGGGTSGAAFVLNQDRFGAKIELNPLTGKSTVTLLEPRT